VPVTHGKVWLLSAIQRPCGKAVSVSQRKNLRGWAQTTASFSGLSGPKFTKFGEDVGDSLSIDKFLSDFWHRVSFPRYFQSNFEVGPEKAVFAPRPVGVYARGTSDQHFQIAGIPEYVSKFAWDPFNDLRD